MSERRKVKPHDDAARQFERFRQVARELECDEDEERFNANLKKIAKDGARKGQA